MQRLIHIRLRHRDIIFKPARHRHIKLMHHTQNGIALVYRIYNYAHGEQIVYFVYGFILSIHFSEYAVNALCPARNLKFYVHFAKFFGNCFDYIRNVLLAFRFFLLYAFRNFIIRNAVKVAERQIFKFAFNCRNT